MKLAGNDNTVITPRIANEVLYYFSRSEGHYAGYYFNALFDLASHADKTNLELLASIYPAHIKAFTQAKSEEGIQMLRVIGSMQRLVAL